MDAHNVFLQRAHGIMLGDGEGWPSVPSKQADILVAVQPGHTRLHSMDDANSVLSNFSTDNCAGLGHKPQHDS